MGSFCYTNSIPFWIMHPFFCLVCHTQIHSSLCRDRDSDGRGSPRPIGHRVPFTNMSSHTVLKTNDQDHCDACLLRTFACIVRRKKIQLIWNPTERTLHSAIFPGFNSGNLIPNSRIYSIPRESTQMKRSYIVRAKWMMRNE